MIVKKLITEQDLHTEDLVVEQGKLRVNPARLRPLFQEATSNVTEYVLDVVPTGNVIQIAQDAHTNTRKMVSVNGLGVGVVSLDFTYRGTNNARTVAFRMPADAPLPAHTIATNTIAGAGLLWWNKGSREIVFHQVQNNQRVILNLIGLFI